jgi:hypothetical protein
MKNGSVGCRKNSTLIQRQKNSEQDQRSYRHISHSVHFRHDTNNELFLRLSVRGFSNYDISFTQILERFHRAIWMDALGRWIYRNSLR